MTATSDRALQDQLIRLLADAPFHDALMHVDEGVAYGGLTADQVEAMRAGDLRRMDRFARFLARQYYHERLWHFHKYSRALAHWTGRSPEGLLQTPAFAALLPTIILGSRTTARRPTPATSCATRTRSSSRRAARGRIPPLPFAPVRSSPPS